MYIDECFQFAVGAEGNCSAVMCHAFQAQVFSHKDCALLYGDGSCFNAMVGITRSKVITILFWEFRTGCGNIKFAAEAAID